MVHSILLYEFELSITLCVIINSVIVLNASMERVPPAAVGYWQQQLSHIVYIGFGSCHIRLQMDKMATIPFATILFLSFGLVLCSDYTSVSRLKSYVEVERQLRDALAKYIDESPADREDIQEYTRYVGAASF